MLDIMQFGQNSNIEIVLTLQCDKHLSCLIAAAQYEPHTADLL